MIPFYDPYVEALDEFETYIEGLTGRPQQKQPSWWRAKFIIEEAIEADEAIRDTDPFTDEPNDLVQVAKELADVLYVTFGAARKFNIPIREVFEIVHDSNMSKLDNPEITGEGKIVKGPDYEPPYEAIRKCLTQ